MFALQTLRILVSTLLLLASGTGLAMASATWREIIGEVPVWVTVVSAAREDPTGSDLVPWWQWGNTATDSYIFSFGVPDTPTLILSFTTNPTDTERDAVRATFYLAEPEQTLQYRLANDGSVRIYGVSPYINIDPVVAEGWLIDGKTNYNLDITVIRPRDVQITYPPFGRRVERHIKVRGDRPGVPDYQMQELTGVSPKERGLRLFSLNLRVPSAPPFRVAEGVMPTFPIFGIGPSILRSSWFQENPPPIYFNTSESTIDVFNFAGFQEGGIYRISSSSPPPLVDFESPFITYSFDDRTRYAHLVVRADSFPHLEESRALYADQLTRTSFRYSWKLEDETRWRYSLQLAGSIPYEHEHTYSGVTVVAPDYDEAPGWIMDQEWPMVTFVESVEGTRGSEGIYYYTVQGTAPWRWMAGDALEPPPYDTPYLPKAAVITNESLLGLPDGYRGEYHTQYFRSPMLYLSPVDNRLHLSEAQGGIWNLGDGFILRSNDRDGDGYIDTWQREHVFDVDEVAQEDGDVPQAEAGQVLETLYLLDDHLVYVNTEELIIRRSTIPPYSLVLAPPEDRESWLAFRQTMQPYEGAERSPWDLSGWLTAFPGAQLRVPATIENVNLDAGGFSAVMTVTGRPEGSGEEILTLTTTGPTEINFERATGAWRQRATGQAVLSAEATAQGSGDDSVVRRWTPARLEVLVSNTGAADWHGDLILRSGDRILARWNDTEVPSTGQLQVATTWTPQEAATWELFLDAGAQSLDLGEFSVRPVSRFGDRTLVTIQADRTPIYLAVLMGLIALTIVVCLRQIGRPG